MNKLFIYNTLAYFIQKKYFIFVTLKLEIRMKKIFNIALVAFFLLHDFRLFAQGDEDDNGDLEGDDTPAAPINSKLLYLAIVGIAFAYYTYKSRKKQIS